MHVTLKTLFAVGLSLLSLVAINAKAVMLDVTYTATNVKSEDLGFGVGELGTLTMAVTLDSNNFVTDDYWLTIMYSGTSYDFSDPFFGHVNILPDGGAKDLIVLQASPFTPTGGSFALQLNAVGNLFPDGYIYNPVPTDLTGLLNIGQFNCLANSDTPGDNKLCTTKYPYDFTGTVAENVPEPGTLALLGIGLVGVGARKLRRRA